MSERGKVYRIVTGHENEDKYAEMFLKYGVIAIGWGTLEDISKLTEREIKEEAKKKFPDQKNAGITICKFKNEIQKGDIIIAYKRRNTVAAVGEVVGDYYYDTKDELGSPDKLGYPHKRKVKWWGKPRMFDRRLLSPELSKFLARQGTIHVLEYDQTALKEALMKITGGEKDDALEKKRVLDGNKNDKILKILTALKTKPFLIFAGVSGTGKTQIARIIAGIWSKKD